MPAPAGNLNSAKGREWTSALRRAMAHRGEGDYRHTLLAIADAVVAKALEGDRDAWREIAEREDGKPMQSVGQDPEAEPFRHVFTWKTE